MPKKAVAIFFIAAFIGAALFVFFTFPRTKEEIPKSNNQRPFPSSEPGPSGVPVPESFPGPTAPKAPPGPTLRVMAWATGDEAKALSAEADSFAAATGHRAAFTIIADPARYRQELQQALASANPPDVCLVNSRDFSGLDPAHDLINVEPQPGTVPRSLAAFTIKGDIKAAPSEFSVDVLFYNPALFDQAGIGYPDRHWNWDILEAMTRAIASLNIKNAAGQAIYPLELPADFDFWNVLCTQAGHPALDRDVWHLTDSTSKLSQLRALDFIHQFFQELTVAAPLPPAGTLPGKFFAQQRAAILLGPSELAATLPKFNYGITLLPGDITRASLARVNGWAVPAKSSQPEAAASLAAYLSRQAIHTGWSSTQKPADLAANSAVYYEALDQSLLPRIDAKSEALAQFLDRQIDLLARGSSQKTVLLYTRILAEYQDKVSPDANISQPAGLKPGLLAPSAPQVRQF